MVLGLFILPTLFSAYSFGRRHATLTAVASFLQVIFLTGSGPLATHIGVTDSLVQFHILAWGCTLIITGYAMGTLFDLQRNSLQGLQKAHHSVLMVLPVPLQSKALRQRYPLASRSQAS